MDNKPVTNENQDQKAVERQAIKSDYKQWQESLSFKDLTAMLDKCYNDYIKYSKDVTQPQSYRLGWLDQATGIEKIRDYIQRQVK